MAWNPETGSWAPGEPPVGDASVLAPDTHDTPPVKGAVPQQPTNFLSDIDSSTAKVQRDLVGPAQDAQKAQTAADRQRDDDTKKDRERMERAWGYERADANDPALRPWNADQEKANRVRGPMEQFGSAGFIFAMAASAFTRTPMTSALNAGAAAMTAIQQGDEKAYEHAYKAWKDNSDLAIRRFDMEHRLYEDADKLLTTDMNLWKQKTLEIAAQFDDQKKITMLQNGMDPEVLKSREALIKSKVEIQKYQQNFEEFEAQRKMISEGIQALRQVHKDWKDDNKSSEQTVAESEVYKRAVRASKGMESRGAAPNQQQYELIRQKYEGDPDAESKIAEEYAKFVREQKQPAGGAGAGGAVGSPERERTRGVAKVLQEELDKGLLSDQSAAGVEKRREELMRLAKELETPLPPRAADALKGQIGRLDRADEIITKTEKLMKDHAMITGLGGKISRPTEVIGNVLGSNSTAYKQFESDISLLQEWTKRLLTNAASEGRPLKSSELAISKIVPGLSLGDTVQHTATELKQLKDLFRQMREEDVQRLGGTFTPESSKATTGGSKSSGSWRSIAIPVR